MAEIAWRRRLMVFLNIVTYAGLLFAAGQIMSAGGWTVVDILMFACMAVSLPWAVLGFWNAVVGLWLRLAVRDPLKVVAPYAAAGEEATPLQGSTAILMTLRNEDPTRALSRLKTIKRSLDETSEGAHFDYFVLSDTTDAKVAAKEEQLIEAWRAVAGLESRIVYRRRQENTGFKAGNVRDFCSRWGQHYELMLMLDADSLMSGETIVSMARMMQAHPRIGILQSLVVGTPSESAFARVFQFGMRHGMRTYTMGQAWWAADCGPFWGHNALVRVKPFYDSCALPEVSGQGPFAGHVLSHDQVEATLMRRAGFEVQVLPVEAGSWEDNPPTLVDYIKREQRWCQGNLQYMHLMPLLKGLQPMSRFQLVWAILMFVSLPAGVLFTVLLPFAAYEAQSMEAYPVTLTIAFYLTYLTMSLMPKLAGFVDVALTPGETKRYGGGVRFALGALIELAVSFLQGAVTTTRTTLFMAALMLTGRSVKWGGQDRDVHGVRWQTAVSQFWPQTVLGFALIVALAVISPIVLLWSLPLIVGYALAIPYAVLSASPSLGKVMTSSGLCGVPEDFKVASEIAALRPQPTELEVVRDQVSAETQTGAQGELQPASATASDASTIAA